MLKEQHIISSASFGAGMKIVFSKKNKTSFLRAAYVYIENYFFESLKKLTKENPQADIVFHTIDESHFMAALYLNGTKVSRCKIWFDGRDAFPGGIAYSPSYSFSDSCPNDALTVEEENGKLYLKSIQDNGKENKMTIKPGAEYLWKKFIGTINSSSN